MLSNAHAADWTSASVASRRSTQKRASQRSAARSNRSGRLTGESYVPVLVLDHGEVIEDSDNIVAARDNPAGGAA